MRIKIAIESRRETTNILAIPYVLRNQPANRSGVAQPSEPPAQYKLVFLPRLLKSTSATKV